MQYLPLLATERARPRGTAINSRVGDQNETLKQLDGILSLSTEQAHMAIGMNTFDEKRLDSDVYSCP